MSYSFTRTGPQLVAKILRRLGAIGIDQTPQPEDTAVVREAMDLRLKEMHTLGVLWFNVAPAATELTLTAASATASLAAVTDFLFPVSMKLRISGDDRDIEIISHQQYQDIPNKTDTGEPEKVMIANGTAYLWPVPDDAYTAKLTYEATAADTTATGAPDLPVSMMNAFADIVAGDLVEEFEVAEPKASRLIAYAQTARRTILTLNSPRVANTTVEMESF